MLKLLTGQLKETATILRSVTYILFEAYELQLASMSKSQLAGCPPQRLTVQKSGSLHYAGWRDGYSYKTSTSPQEQFSKNFYPPVIIILIIYASNMIALSWFEVDL